MYSTHMFEYLGICTYLRMYVHIRTYTHVRTYVCTMNIRTRFTLYVRMYVYSSHDEAMYVSKGTICSESWTTCRVKKQLSMKAQLCVSSNTSKIKHIFFPQTKSYLMKDPGEDYSRNM